MRSLVVILALLALIISGGLRLVTARHEARADRLARCEAEVARARHQTPAAIEKLSRLFAGGSPNAACELAEASATWDRPPAERASR